jgi:membrane protease subunit (stomatin/prohibitin family)
MAIEVLEWKDDSGSEMVWRHAQSGAIKLGAQLVVREGQAAVFFKDGKSLDTFGPGRHTLTTKNIPLLTRLIGLPFGGTSPFRADVYFVSQKVFTDLKWGTKDPVVFRDTELSMVRLRAHGVYAVRVADGKVFLGELVGSMGRYTTEEIEGYLREVIVSRLNDVLGESVRTLFDLPSRYDELAEALKTRVASDFEKHGLRLADLFINAITPPEEVQRIMDERSGMAAAGDPEAYLRFKAARALGDAARSGSGGAASAAVGVGAGAALGLMIPGMVQQAARGATAAGFCAACGAALPAGASFCPGCGAKKT